MGYSQTPTRPEAKLDDLRARPGFERVEEDLELSTDVCCERASAVQTIVVHVPALEIM